MRKLTIALLAFSPLAASQFDYSQYVNPFWGTEGPIPNYTFGGGAVFVGAAVPYGVVKLTMDTYVKNTSIAALQGGYTPNGLITGFSMMHESGTGGCSKYGVISQMPLTNIEAPVNLLDNRTYWQERVGQDHASVGYFRTNLENGVTTELSATRHAGILHYEFPKDEKKHILVDVSHYLPNVVGGYCTQTFRQGKIKISPDRKSYRGYGTFAGGFNEGAPYTVYFCGEFETAPDEAETFAGRNQFPGFNAMNPEPLPWPVFASENMTTPEGSRVGAVFTWKGNQTTVRSKIGISFISEEKACRFKDEEIKSWDIQNTVDAAVEEWNREIFSTIRVDTGNETNQEHLTLLYSSLYFMHLIPSNRTGENPLWQSEEPYWDDFYCLWDTFRNTISLSHLIQTDAYESQIRSLIDIWRNQGYMPDGRSGNDNGLVQGGSNSDNVLADAYVKGLRGKIDWADGYAAMVKNAEIPTNGSNKEGRGAGGDWLQYGYVSSSMPRSISRTVEYSLNDFALSQVAKGEKSGDVSRYLKRSAGWQLLWDPSTQSVNTSKNFSGFLTPKDRNGTFNQTDYNPAKCGACSWSSLTYEGTPFEYSFTIPHDMKTLIEKMGGPQGFEERLDYIFVPYTSQADLGPNGAGINTIMNIGNEPDFATPYLYNYLNKQWKSVNKSRSQAKQYFRNTTNGMPGNSDAGALNSWLIWQMLGLYPIVTQPVYLLESPWFRDINMTISRDKTLRITANGIAEDSFYVQGVKINGVQWDRNWFNHDDVFHEGGTIEFDLGKQPVVWEKGDLPPSPGSLG
ncbi:glycoside hydrolase family 92 protein [Bipolaris maydis ATCC 48331]|uniref:Glycoside hydrolase family 92 protein n=2 Tax=Cochliobolus heterostrophus TaxID=5016 RepID=M2TXV2_COCH5|nr:glycoside hydrolase family 92 protein [Bipolaris maydis ATCC 48331]EMD86541.1 glycoside hydrolase family 92 protein [Bipolaris maydis C5]KAJ5029813.1 glycoside hydrolase [Bipolaris maydis]ENI06489.1 glycoside hydrolase family 92 protein [Bipolaris maydis ATCC 48331]KAJ6275343.1 glycoside hydrolase [Bipolaris maydis]KAJ6285366.1 glycoside hydrolase [Bipolaris maydis]